MNNKISFILALVIGILVISISFYFFWDIDKVAEYVAIYVAGSTALYAILAEPSLNKIEKQEIYGKLKAIITNDIDILERREFQDLSFGLWDNIQQDHRYHYFDEKFAHRCDAFLERMRKYSSIIYKLDNFIVTYNN